MNLAQFMRPGAVVGAGASGGLIGSLFQLFLREASWSGIDSSSCPWPPVELDPPTGVFQIDWKSVILCIFIGYWLGPVLETLVLLRQLWGLHLRTYFRVQGTSRESYRVVG